MRKMISFKIENLPEKERKIIDDWANEQSNIQQSLANIIMHVVEFTGNGDVMDFNVQRKLHTIFTNSETPDVAPNTIMHAPIKQTASLKEDVSENKDVYTDAAALFND